MYSIGVVYNTFPTPPGYQLGELDLSVLEPLAQGILDARGQFADSTLANLYDPDLMPPSLRKAHQALDRAVDRMYRPKAHASPNRASTGVLHAPVRRQRPLAGTSGPRPDPGPDGLS